MYMFMYIIYYVLFIPVYIFNYILILNTDCPALARTIGVATIDLGAEILATAAGPRGT